MSSNAGRIQKMSSYAGRIQRVVGTSMAEQSNSSTDCEMSKMWKTFLFGRREMLARRCFSSSTVIEPAYGATGEEALWFEEDSVHAQMLRRQIVGET
jgi:hypothetical protein